MRAHASSRKRDYPTPTGRRPQVRRHHHSRRCDRADTLHIRTRHAQRLHNQPHRPRRNQCFQYFQPQPRQDVPRVRSSDGVGCQRLRLPAERSALRPRRQRPRSGPGAPVPRHPAPLARLVKQQADFAPCGPIRRHRLCYCYDGERAAVERQHTHRDRHPRATVRHHAAPERTRPLRQLDLPRQHPLVRGAQQPRTESGHQPTVHTRTRSAPRGQHHHRALLRQQTLHRRDGKRHGIHRHHRWRCAPHRHSRRNHSCQRKCRKP